MTPDWERLEQLGADIEAGRRASVFVLIDQLARALPNTPPREIAQMASAMLKTSDYKQ
jgi:hypothetical protein